MYSLPLFVPSPTIFQMHAETLDTFFRRLYEKFPSSPQRNEVAHLVKDTVARISPNRVAIRSMGTLDRLYNVVSRFFFALKFISDVATTGRDNTQMYTAKGRICCVCL